MKFEQAIAYLERRVNYENFQNLPYSELMGRLGQLRKLLIELKNPEKRFLTVHVAGTKGKGSTCAMLQSILRQAGYRVGSFSSPHLYSPLERFVVDEMPCDAEEFGELMLSLRNRLESRKNIWDFTYFELTTLFAFEYFARRQVDIAILEVGLGGRLDATNVCSPTVTVITNISFDHTEQLGPTLESIATEKAGIIKPGIPLVAGPEDGNAERVIQETAEAVGAPSYFLGEDFSVVPEESGANPTFRFVPSPSSGTPFREVGALSMKLLGGHQRNNAALAIAGVQLLEDHLKIPVDVVRNGLAEAFLPIRVEQFRSAPDAPTFVVDGAHNRASIRALILTLKDIRPFRKKFLLFGTSLGKDIEGMFAEILPFFDHIILTQHSSSPRRFPPQGLLHILRLQQLETTSGGAGSAAIEAEEDSLQAFEKCWNMAETDDLVCVTGSMYLAAELRQFFQSRG